MKEPEKQNEVSYMTVDDFLQDATESTVVAELYREIQTEAAQKLLDETQLRRQEDWSVLAHQVVGAESM